MAEATLTELRNMHPALETIEDDTLNQHLSDAKNYIEALGITTTNVRFSELQRFKTCHLLAVANIGRTDIDSESVADVSVSYGGNSDLINFYNSTNWEREFNKVRIQIEGMLDRCL